MIDEILNFLFGLVDGTSDNDEDTIEKMRLIERERLKIDLKGLLRK